MWDNLKEFEDINRNRGETYKEHLYRKLYKRIQKQKKIVCDVCKFSKHGRKKEKIFDIVNIDKVDEAQSSSQNSGPSNDKSYELWENYSIILDSNSFIVEKHNPQKSMEGFQFINWHHEKFKVLLNEILSVLSNNKNKCGEFVQFMKHSYIKFLKNR